MAQSRWWVLIFLAALVLLGSASGFFLLRRPSAPKDAPPPSAHERCPDADAELPQMKVEPEPALLFVGVGPGVRVLLEGKPTPDQGAAPLRLSPGQYGLRAEADGVEPLQLRLALEPFSPALVQLEVDPALGLTAAVLGAACPSCRLPGDKPLLDFTRTSDGDATLLTGAAIALRAGDWKRAASQLRGVSPKSREHAAFLRLSSAVYQLSGQGPSARAALGRIPLAEAQALTAPLEAWTALADAELTRSKGEGMRRWNLLTERFSALLEKFAPEAPGPVQIATSRLAELSSGFLEASLKKDLRGQEDTVRAAEAALGQFVRALRRSHPEDCEFQKRITASL